MKFLWRSALVFASMATAASVAPAEVSQETDEIVDPLAPTVALPEIDAVLDVGVTGGEDAEPYVAPEPDLPQDLYSKVEHFKGTQTRNAQMECLAGAVYFETRGESLEGQLAVARVIANRAESGRFPDSYCGVVFQRSQFSFVRGGKMPSIKRNSKAWKRAVAIARIVDGEHHESQIPDALFFHARYVNPRWRLTRLGRIDNHIFYR
ncbi:MAG: cell wall hydrolase [Sphingomonas sp.]|nr:cell wall hydrolase [Sphingomonas sp.]RZV49736.1 MAG: cell wall hydrolase [Sphingomonadaceae bacterium]